jgi:hypothetical protein
MGYPMVAACPLWDGRREKVRLQAAQMFEQESGRCRAQRLDRLQAEPDRDPAARLR